MNKKYLTIAAAIITLILTGMYFTSPVFATYKLVDAVKDHDVERIDALVDFPSVREGLKSQIKSYATEQVMNESDPFVALGGVFVIGMVDTMVDSMVTPNNLIKLLESSEAPDSSNHSFDKADNRKQRITEFDYISLNRFRVVTNPSENLKLTLVFERKGFMTWKLIRVVLPEDKVADNSNLDTPSQEVKPAREIDQKFLAVYGDNPRTTYDGQTYTWAAEKLIYIDSTNNTVLISKGRNDNDSHSGTGALSITYFIDEQQQPTRVFYDGNSMGEPPDIEINRDLLNNPSIILRTSWSGMGCVSTNVGIIELTQTKPIAHVNYVSSYEYEYGGSFKSEMHRTSNGFEVVYTGSVNKVVKYTRVGEKLVSNSDPNEVEGC